MAGCALNYGEVGMETSNATPESIGSLLTAVKDAINPVLGIATVIATSIIAYLTTKIKTLSEERIADGRTEVEERRDTITASIQMRDSQTNEFRVLLESYQRHVDQLTAEVHSLRQEVTNLRTALSARLTMCSGCDRFAEWQQNFSDITRSLEPPHGSGT